MPATLTDENLEDYKEVFLLHDKDEDGKLTLVQTRSAIVLLGLRVAGIKDASSDTRVHCTL